MKRFRTLGALLAAATALGVSLPAPAPSTVPTASATPDGTKAPAKSPASAPSSVVQDVGLLPTNLLRFTRRHEPIWLGRPKGGNRRGRTRWDYQR